MQHRSKRGATTRLMKSKRGKQSPFCVGVAVYLWSAGRAATTRSGCSSREPLFQGRTVRAGAERGKEAKRGEPVRATNERSRQPREAQQLKASARTGENRKRNCVCLHRFNQQSEAERNIKFAGYTERAEPERSGGG